MVAIPSEKITLKEIPLILSPLAIAAWERNFEEALGHVDDDTVFVEDLQNETVQERSSGSLTLGISIPGYGHFNITVPPEQWSYAN